MKHTPLLFLLFLRTYQHLAIAQIARSSRSTQSQTSEAMQVLIIIHIYCYFIINKVWYLRGVGKVILVSNQ